MCNDRFSTWSVRSVRICHQSTVLLRQEESRSNCIYTQTFSEFDRQFTGQVFSQVGNGGFGSTITHDAGKRAQGGFGREVNDSTFSLVSHYIGKYHCRENCSEQIQVYHLTESVDVQVENRAVRSDGRASHITAGCIQQCIDATIFGQDIFFVLFQNFFV